MSVAEKKEQKKIKPWKNSIVGHGEVDPKTLVPNPENWRLHGDTQTKVMNDVLSEVGWIQQVIVNKTTGRIVDGHLRVSLALERNEPLVPVTYVELSAEDEKKALLTLDPLGAIADSDVVQFSDLVSELDTDSLWIRELMDVTQKRILGQHDEDENIDEGGVGGEGSDESLPEMELQPFEGYDYVMLLFKSDQDFQSTCDILKIEKVKVTYQGGSTKVGLGRVIDGALALQILKEKYSNEK